MNRESQIERILNLIQKFRSSEYHTREHLSGDESPLDAVIAGLNDLGEVLQKNSEKARFTEKRINALMELLLSYTVMDFSHKAKISEQGDEIDAIAVGLNYLGEEISEALRRNETYYKELEQKARQLEASNKELESFSYSVSHDLRSPLRAIHGYSQILTEDYGKKLDSEGRRLVKTIMNNAKKMGNLIDDLLAYSRLDRKEFRRSRINLNDLVKNVIQQINEPGKDRTEITVQNLPEIYGDQTMITQVFINLISNAIKYSKKTDNPRVEIGVMRKNNRDPVFFVQDKGIGFDMSYYDKLFGVFQRLHHEDEYEGTGVGLPIVNRVIRRHGGKVWAEAELNKGATFFFTINSKPDNDDSETG